MALLARAPELAPLPAVGLLRRRALGSEALYRVIGRLDVELVEVEAVSVPGLARGARLRITAAAAAAMERVAPVGVPTAGGEPLTRA